MRSFGFLVALALAALLTDCGSATMAAAPRYVSSVLIRPSGGVQLRTIQVRPDTYACDAITRVRSDLKNVRCYDVLTLQLGPFHPRGAWKEGYASIRRCIARLTRRQVRAGCVQSVQSCSVPKGGACPPAWTAHTSIEFRTDARRVRKEWMTCGIGIFHRFQFHLRWCGTASPLESGRIGWLSFGDNYELDIPGVVQDGTAERFVLRPDGALLFEDCCA